MHTNSNLYTGHNLLTFQSKVTYGTDWVIGFMPGDARAPTAVARKLQPRRTIRAICRRPLTSPINLLVSMPPVSSPTTDNNPNNDSYHELIEPPIAGYTDPLAGKRYYDQAGVKITIDGSNNITIKDQQQQLLTASSPGQWRSHLQHLYERDHH